MKEKLRLLEAINKVRLKISWKPGSDIQHLKKRKQRGHLPENATLAEYEKIICTLLNDKNARAFIYWYEQIPYAAIVGKIKGDVWLLMFGFDGVIESAFVMERPDRYLKNPDLKKSVYYRRLTMNYKKLLDTYETDVQFPEVNGLEHLDMLMTRSEIAKYEIHLTALDKSRLLKADRRLLQNARKFYQSIQQIADLAIWREEENAPVTHWWWYLDVIIQVPDFDETVSSPSEADAEYA